MGDILGYKDALEYREVDVKSKVNNEKYLDIQKNTLKQIIDSKSNEKMTKSKELKSNVF